MTRRFALAIVTLLAAGCSQTVQPVISFPPAPARPQLVYLGRLDQAPIDPPVHGSLRRWLGDAPGFLQAPLARPFGLAAFGHRLYICDPPSAGLIVIDYDAQDAISVADLGKPTAVAVDGAGVAYIADSKGGRIHRLNRDLGKLRPIDPPVPSFRPVALTLTPTALFVADIAGHRILPYDLKSSQWLPPIASDQPLGYPAGVCMSGEKLWVADALDGRLFVADLPAGPLHAIAAPARRLRPKHLATDNAGGVFVTDAALQRLQHLDAAGRTLLDIADPSLVPLPSGICVSAELASFYTSRLPAGFTASHILFVSNQSGPPGIAVFAASLSRS